VEDNDVAAFSQPSAAARCKHSATRSGTRPLSVDSASSSQAAASVASRASDASSQCQPSGIASTCDLPFARQMTSRSRADARSTAAGRRVRPATPRARSRRPRGGSPTDGARGEAPATALGGWPRKPRPSAAPRPRHRKRAWPPTPARPGLPAPTRRARAAIPPAPRTGRDRAPRAQCEDLLARNLVSRWSATLEQSRGSSAPEPTQAAETSRCPREPLIRLANLRPSGRCPSPKTRRPHKPSACRADV